MRTWARLLVTLTGGLLLLVLTAGPASAHASLQTTNPGNGAVLATAPPTVDLVFDEPINLTPESVRVFDAAGARVPTATRAVDATATATFDGSLAPGSYVVSWRVVSADGHPLDGAFTFAVGAPSPVTVTPSTPEPSAAVTWALRIGTALADAGLLLAVGLGVFVGFLLPAATSLAPTRERLGRLQRGAAVVAVVGSLLLIPLLRLWQQAGTLADLDRDATWQGLFRADVIAPPVMVAAGLAAVLRGADRRWPVLAGGALALASLPVNGHTRAYGPGWLSYPLDLLHVSAGALWLGALVGITVALHRRSQAAARDVATAVARFSGLALETTVVLTAAGVILASLILGPVTDLLSTAWGRTLLVKVGVVGVVLVVAAVNRGRLLPRVERETAARGEAAGMAWLRRTVRLEAAGLAVVLAITGVLVTQSPVSADDLPGATGTPNPSAPATAPTRQPLGSDGSISFTVAPVARGTNTVTIVLADADGRPLTPLSTPTLETSLADRGLGPFQQRVTRTAPGRYRADVDLAYPGRWLLTYRIRLDTFTEVTPQFPVEVP